MNQGNRSGAKRRASLTSLPAANALAIQLVSLVLVVVLIYLLRILGEYEINLGLAAVLQGLVAATITYKHRLPAWWLFIQLLFPIGLVAALGLHIPPLLFLAGFFVLLGLYWAVIITRVPLYLSGPAVWRSIADQLPQGRPVRFVDIGSGLGGVVLHLAQYRPDSSFTGIELAPFPWLISKIAGYARSSQCRFVRGNYNNHDFSQYDVVFAYLSPLVMDSLWAKVNAEMRPGTLLLSYEFPIPGITPHIVIHPDSGGSTLYGWRF